MKLLIISQDLPPAVGGSPILIDNLFKYFPGEVLGITGYHGSQYEDKFKPSFPVLYINPPNFPLIGSFLKKHHDKLLRYFHFYIKYKIKKIIKNYNPDAIYSNCPNIDYFICAFQIAKEYKIPFYAHMHDLWEENAKEGSYIKEMAIKWERNILTTSHRLLCMTESQILFYKEKYEIKGEILPHSIKDDDLNTVNQIFKPALNNYILFTGAVSPVMNKDALKTLAQVASEIKTDNKFILCTSESKENLELLGFNFDQNCEKKWLTRGEVQKLQSESLILFAPLSHKNCGMEEVKTVFSTKILEYLVSGRPILIFAPKDSHHAIHAKKFGWAYVIDEDDVQALKNAIEILTNDQELTQNLVANAYKEALRRRASVYAEKFCNLIKQDLNK